MTLDTATLKEVEHSACKALAAGEITAHDLSTIIMYLYSETAISITYTELQRVLTIRNDAKQSEV